MAIFAFCAPVLDNKLDTLRSFTAQLAGDRLSEAQQARQAAGLEREQIFVQQTPNGAMAIVVWDTADPAKVFETWATDSSEFGVWFRKHLKEIHGLDLADPTMVAPKVTLLDEWKDSSWTFGELDAWAFTIPVKSVDGPKKFVSELLGKRKDEFVRSRLEYGVKRTSFFTVESGDSTFQVNYIEGAPGSFPKAFAATSTGDDAFYVWWREQVQAFAVVPMFVGEVPKIECMLDLKGAVPAQV